MVLQKLRKLYGRRENRESIKITIQPETMSMVRDVVEFGRGKYGSPLFELAVRTLIVLFNGTDSEVEQISREIQLVAPNNSRIIRNLDYLRKLLEA